jgi:PleD family two-component response regulator
VIEASDGREALMAASQSNPDLMIVDIHMPHVDGFDVIKGVRGIVGLTGLPIIVLSSDNNDEKQFQAIDLGADDYLAQTHQTPPWSWPALTRCSETSGKNFLSSSSERPLVTPEQSEPHRSFDRSSRPRAWNGTTKSN